MAGRSLAAYIYHSGGELRRLRPLMLRTSCHYDLESPISGMSGRSNFASGPHSLTRTHQNDIYAASDLLSTATLRDRYGSGYHVNYTGGCVLVYGNLM